MKLRAVKPMPSAHRNRGVALFVSLVLLLVLTIIGVSSVQTTSLETRMARNEHDSLLAFQAAESALRDAERWIDAQIDSVDDINTRFTPGGANGLWEVANPGAPDHWQVPGNWTGGGSVGAATVVDADVAEAPRYMIEHLANVRWVENPYQITSDYPDANDRIAMFRITARGVGGSAHAQVLLQTTFGRLVD